MLVKKKQAGGLNKFLLIISFLFFFIFCSYSFGSQILDYETEEFLNEILNDIAVVNKINKKIKFKINNSDEINAFVNHKNVIHINSGLIENCQDYVALLSVLAHEVGHIDLNHISIRKKKIQNIRKYNNLTFLSVIAGSAISQNYGLLQSNIISSAAASNQYIVFTKEQEMEADLYSLNTLKLLNTKSN